jgi:predicted lipid-binding transport protein (Tim44 family)
LYTPTTTIMKLTALRPTLARFALLLCAAALLVGAPEVEAKRLGGGGSSGMQRQMPARSPDGSAPAKPATPAQNQSANPAPVNPAAPPAAAPKRNWMGPLAGLAAGLGIAALMSHFGMGEAMGNFLMIALLAMVAIFAVGWLMRRFGPKPPQPNLAYSNASVGQPGGSPWANRQAEPSFQPAAQPVGTNFNALNTGAATGAMAAGESGALAPAVLPPGFDRAGFERIAKTLFIRLQAANDAGQVDDLRKFTTLELFASLRLDVQDRAGQAQQTDVQRVDAEVIDTAQADGQWVASVRFHGLISEVAGAAPQPFDELWHLVRPLDESRDWAIAGIQQSDVASPAGAAAPAARH